MSTEHDRSLMRRKIFPRNLTANAAAVVRGNPANSRPESGVDNTHPGLEFDQRNLDKAFFPGLVFEFQFLHGAKLVAIDRDRFERKLSQDDVDGNIYLYYVLGSFGTEPKRQRLVELHRSDGATDGYEVLRTVRDLEPGRIMVAIATRDPSKLAMLGKGALSFYETLSDPVQYLKDDSKPKPSIFRDPDTGQLLGAILVGNRASYLDGDGMISLDAVPPGDLTRSLCAPWQWDFADCGCHYWAANKPDIVIGPDSSEQTLNFQRVRPARSRGRRKKPETPPILYADWTKRQMTQPQMISGWETLPFVIAERETDRAPPLGAQKIEVKWSREEVVQELKYLASIEHALAVEYLYAYYSLDAPRSLPQNRRVTRREKDLFTAAQVIRSIAVDEMRHLRWVNEALQLLGGGVYLKRATEFKQKKERIRGQFKLLPLTPGRLRFFINIEAPSKVWNQKKKLDGLYTRLLNALCDPESKLKPLLRRQLKEIVKLIIDEGHSHYERFKRIRKLLSRYDKEDYLRVAGGPSARADDPAEINELRALANWNYYLVLKDIEEAFAHQPGTRNDHITDARRAMYNLDDTGEELAARGFGMPFDLSLFDANDAESGVPRVEEALLSLSRSDDARLRRLAHRNLKSFAQKRGDKAR